MNRLARICALFLLSRLGLGQVVEPKPPCAFSSDLLRNAQGNILPFSSREMKRRATHKVDISDFMKQLDVKGIAVLEVLVGPSGEVICVKTLAGNPILQAEVEKALRSWTFEPAKTGGQAVAYLGRLEFTLCNISCGKEGIHMSLLR